MITATSVFIDAEQLTFPVAVLISFENCFKLASCVLFVSLKSEVHRLRAATMTVTSETEI